MNEITLYSSALAGLRYDPDRRQLWLRFRTGAVYKYQAGAGHCRTVTRRSTLPRQILQFGHPRPIPIRMLILALMGFSPAPANYSNYF